VEARRARVVELEHEAGKQAGADSEGECGGEDKSSENGRGSESGSGSGSRSEEEQAAAAAPRAGE